MSVYSNKIYTIYEKLCLSLKLYLKTKQIKVGKIPNWYYQNLDKWHDSTMDFKYAKISIVPVYQTIGI